MVILPDHLHCIWTLPYGDADFSTRWHDINAKGGMRFAFPPYGPDHHQIGTRLTLIAAITISAMGYFDLNRALIAVTVCPAVVIYWGD